jgi:hypothetical protein
MAHHIRIDGLGIWFEDNHQHALVWGGVEPVPLVPLNWTYFATETFPC